LEVQVRAATIDVTHAKEMEHVRKDIVKNDPLSVQQCYLARIMIARTARVTTS
jgi:hypothetical protein